VWWSMLIEVGIEWRSNQLDEFKILVVWNPKTQSKEWTLLTLCPMYQKLKKWHIGIQQNISSTRCKTHMGDLKDGAVMIPFTKCSWDDKCLPNFSFSTKWIHSARSVTPYCRNCYLRYPISSLTARIPRSTPGEKTLNHVESRCCCYS
jgi:hypothetical protein